MILTQSFVKSETQNRKTKGRRNKRWLRMIISDYYTRWTLIFLWKPNCKSLKTASTYRHEREAGFKFHIFLTASFLLAVEDLCSPGLGAPSALRRTGILFTSSSSSSARQTIWASGGAFLRSGPGSHPVRSSPSRPGSVITQDIYKSWIMWGGRCTDTLRGCCGGFCASDHELVLLHKYHKIQAEGFWTKMQDLLLFWFLREKPETRIHVGAWTRQQLGFILIFTCLLLTCEDTCLRSIMRFWTSSSSSSRAGTTRSAPAAAAAARPPPPLREQSRQPARATGAGLPAESGRCSRGGIGSTATGGSWWRDRPGFSTWPWSSSCSPAASSSLSSM